MSADFPTAIPAGPRERRVALEVEMARLGFQAWGVTTAEPAPWSEYLETWLSEGRHGAMEWMRHSREKRQDPQLVLPGARSILCLGLNYFQEPPPGHPHLARYALGADYHDLIYPRLKSLCRLLRTWGGDQKPYVDTGPVLEKPLAARAGLGWTGKHTNLIHPRLGNWLLLGTILTTLEIEPDTPSGDKCGRCTRCLEICPTRAITAPYQLDARRCLAYLTIEHPGPIPEEFRRAMGDHVFGCDDCLAVCPWNRWARATAEAKFAVRPLPALRETLGWGAEEFLEHFRGTPVRRLGLARWKRNVCVVLGNTGNEADLPALQAAAGDPEALVSEHAAWALREIALRQGGAAAAASISPPGGAEPAVLPLSDTLDLHSFHPRDVSSVTEEYLRECRERGWSPVRLIHGKGRGTLRATVHARLARLPWVRAWHWPARGGDWGSTTVELEV